MRCLKALRTRSCRATVPGQAKRITVSPRFRDENRVKTVTFRAYTTINRLENESYYIPYTERFWAFTSKCVTITFLRNQSFLSVLRSEKKRFGAVFQPLPIMRVCLIRVVFHATLSLSFETHDLIPLYSCFNNKSNKKR